MCALADGKETAGGNVYYAQPVGRGPWTNAFSPGDGVDAISCVSINFCVAGQDAAGFFRYSTAPQSTSWTSEQQGTAAIKSVSCLSNTFCVMADSQGKVHVANSTAQIESSTWKETDVDGTTALNGVACTSTTSCVAVDGAGNVLNLTIETTGKATVSSHNIDGTTNLSAVTCVSTTCSTVDSAGFLFVSKDSGSTWKKWYAFGGSLTSVSCASTTLCVTGNTTGTVTVFNPQGAGTISEAGIRAPQPGWTINYNVPLEGTGAPAQMGVSETTHKPEPEAWGQTDDPVEATSIIAPDSPQGWPAASYKRATTYYLDEQGRNVNVAQPSTETVGSVSTAEYNEENDIVRTLSANNRATSLAAGPGESGKVSHLLDTVNQYNEPECRKETSEKEIEAAPYGTRLCDSWGPQHLVKYTPNGFTEQHEALARIHTEYSYEDAAHGAPASEQFNLVTEASEKALLANKEEVEVRKTSTSYSGQEKLGWSLRAPTSVTMSTEEPGGLKVTHTTLYNKNTGQIIETRAPKGSSGNSPHDARIIYYTSAPNTEGFANCGKHAEWAELICETLPAKQPTGTTAPKLPITTDKYNIWNEPEEILETIEANGTFPETTRTKKSTYDAAGRLETSETTSTADIALPKVKNKYSSTTGMLESQSTTVGETTTTVAATFNTLEQMETYTDADANIAKYKYGTPASDGLLEEMSDSSNAGASNQKYTYDTTTKLLTKLVDSAAGTFTATYDVEGNLATEVYPNAMCAKYTHSATGEATQVEYLKTSNCAESKPPVWFSETNIPSVRGETMSRTSTLANETYTYDRLGRLTETEETPVGEGCTTRLYAYDEESNRESATTRTPGTEGKCATTGGTVETHTYDEANRLTDTGIKYDALSNVTELPAADAEGHILKSSFYVDGAVATQEQSGIKNEYVLDPAGRTRQTTTGIKTVTSHYDAPGDAVAWTSEGTSWTRNIPGIDGALTAIQTNGGTPVLQLHDLKGNITATAALSPAETKLLTTYNNTEFGVPNAGKTPPPYSWLGATDIANTLPSGVITYGATSYIPQTGRPLQATEIEPPGAPGGTGVGAPVDFKEEPWVMQGAAAEAAETPGIEAAEQREAMEAACRAGKPECPTQIIDPEGLASYATTLKRAAQLRSDAVNGKILALAAAWIPGGELLALGFDSYSEALHAAAHNLEVCVAFGQAHSGRAWRWGTCFINEWRVYPPLKLPSFPLFAVAEPCSYLTTRPIDGRSTNVYSCPVAGNVRWGPWFPS